MSYHGVSGKVPITDQFKVGKRKPGTSKSTDDGDGGLMKYAPVAAGAAALLVLGAVFLRPKKRASASEAAA